MAFENFDSSGYIARLAGAIARGNRAIIRIAQTGYSVDISGHNPEHLKIVDRFLRDSHAEFLRQEKKARTNMIYSVGSYLGEVFVENRGADWHFPNLLETLLLFVSWNPARRAERYCYVTVGSVTVDVFQAARRAVTQTARESSLYDFYRRC